MTPDSYITAPGGRATSRTWLFASACAGIFCFGITLALLGTIFGLPEVRARLALDLTRQGTLLAVMYLGLWIATAIVGPVIDRFGNKDVLVASSAFVTVALIGFMVARSFYAAEIAAFLLGFGGGGLNTSTNALTSDLYEEDRGAKLNLLGVFFGIGALFVPLLTASIASLFTASQIIGFTVALSAVSLVIYIALPFPAPREAHSFSLREALRVARYPGVLLFAVMLLFESGNESVIGGWTSTYVGSLGASARLATYILSLYWAGLMIGRLAATRVLARVGKWQVVMGCAVLTFAGYALLVSTASLALIAAGVLITGVAYSAIYPTALAMVGDRYPRFAGSVFGLLFTIALLGSIVMPKMVGNISNQHGLRAGMLVPVGGGIGICVALLFLRKDHGRT